MYRAINSLALILALWAIATPVMCQSPRRVALLLGNWDYNVNARFDDPPAQFPYMTDLYNPCKDIALVKAQLVKFGFEVSDYCNSSRAQFQENVARYFKNLGKLPDYSTVFVYYSGHGVQQRTSMFSIPVGFTDAPSSVVDADTLLRHYERNANNILFLGNLLPRDYDIANILVFDSCRSQAIVEDDGVHNALVTINMRPNTLVQYATTATKTTLDNGKFAEMLAHELASGDPINLAIGRVGSKIWRDYRAGSRETYAESVAGEAFKDLRHLTPLREIPMASAGASSFPTTSTPSQASTVAGTKGVATRNPASTSTGTLEVATELPTANQGAERAADAKEVDPALARVSENERKKKYFSNYRDDYPSVDVLWCVGPGDKARLAHAEFIANEIASRAKEFGVGRVRTVPLSERENNPEHRYNVHMNLMRYDESQKQELPLLKHIAAEFVEYGFLPTRGIGVGGKATPNYVSVFVCGEQPELIP